MANAVTATFGADTSQFNASLVSMETATEAFRKKFRSNLTASFAQLSVTGTTPGKVEQIAEATHGVQGLNLVLKESLVITRELASGNFKKAFSSFTILIQGLYRMQQSVAFLKGLFSSMALTAIGALAGIITSIVIYKERVDRLMESIKNTQFEFPEISARDISKLSQIEQSWKKVTDAIFEATYAADLENKAFEKRSKSLENQQQYAREELQIRKEMEMDQAGNDPTIKANIRKKYDKEEHDLLIKQQSEKAAADKKHIEQLEKEFKDSFLLANSIKVATAEEDKTNLQELKKMAEAGTEKTIGKEGKEKISPIQNAQKTIEELTEKAKPRASREGFGMTKGGLEPEDELRLATAQKTIEDHNQAQTKFNNLNAAQKERDELRQRKHELDTIAAKAKADSIAAKKNRADQDDLDKQIVENDLKIRNLKESREEKRDLGGKITENMSLNAQQKIGAYAAAPPDMKIQTDLLRQVAMNTAAFRPSPNAPPNATPPKFSSLPGK